MIRFHDYFKEDFVYTLYSLDYKKIEAQSVADLELSVNDEISIEKSDDSISCFFTRKMFFEPSDIFSLQVQYKILFDVKEDASISSLTETEIKTALCNDVLESLGEIAARMSLVIAQTLASANHDPIILPPRVLYKMDQQAI